MFFEELVPSSTVSAATVKVESEDFPYPRSGHRIVCYDKNVYSVGGFNSELWEQDNTEETYYPLFREVWRFNVLTKRWSKLKTTGNTPVELASHSAVVHDNYLLVFGGTGVPFGQSSSNDLHALCLRTYKWKCLPCTGDRPIKQYGHAMVINENDLYIIGGTTGFEYNMDVFHLNLKDPKLEWKNLRRKIPLTCKARYRHEAIFHNNSLLVFGGGTNADVCPLSQVDVFDIGTGCWNVLSTRPDAHHGYPKPRRCHGLVKYGNFVYITGGTNGGTLFDDVWRYDVAGNIWTRLQTFLPQAVFFHSTTVSQNGCLFSFGGVLNEANSERSCQLYRFWLNPPSLQQLASERLVSTFPEFEMCSKSFPLYA